MKSLLKGLKNPYFISFVLGAVFTLIGIFGFWLKDNYEVIAKAVENKEVIKNLKIEKTYNVKN